MLSVALEEARYGRLEGGIPIGAALFTKAGKLLSAGTTGAYSRATPACMGRPMLFAVRGGSVATATW